MRFLGYLLSFAMVTAALAADPPINGNVPQPGFIPPQLKGLKGEGVARGADGPIPLPAENEP